MSLFRFTIIALVAALTACTGGSVPTTSSSGTGTLKGKAKLEGETAARGITIVLSGPSSRAAVTLDDGTYLFDKLEAGSYVVTASAPSTEPASVTTTVNVAATGESSAAELVLKPLGTVTGTVTLGAATGNAGVTVAIAGTSAVTLTDDAGRFTLTRVPTGARQVVASYPGFSSASSNVTVRYDTSADAPLLTLTRGSSGQPGSIQGTVALTGEGSHEGIAVSLSGPTSSSAITDTSGTYTFTNLLSGKYVVTAAARSTVEGVVSVPVTVANEQAQASPIAFSPLGHVTGKVTFGKTTGNAGIVVSLTGTPAVAVTDDAGTFTLTNVPTGSWGVAASAPGYVIGTPRTANVTYAKTTTLTEIVLQKSVDPGSIEGGVRFNGLSSPLPSLTVTLSGPVTAATLIDTTTGRYTFNGLKPGTYTVSVTAASTVERTLSASVAVTDKTAAANDFIFSPLGAISGTATLGASTGNAGITVLVPGTSALAITDDAGAYTLRNVPAGLATVTATYPGYATATLSNVGVPYNSTVSADALTLQKTTLPGGLSGIAKVAGETTQPAMTVVITGATTGATQTNAAGEYSFTGLPAGTYNVTVQAPSTQEGSLSTTITVAQTTATATTLNFTPVGTITGSALLGGQTNHAGISVTVPGTQIVAITTAGGSFTLRGVPAGSVSVTASAPGYTMSSSPAVTVKYAQSVALSSPLMLAATASAAAPSINGSTTILGRTDYSGTTVSIVGTNISTTTAADGSFVLQNPPPGLLSLQFTNGGYSETLPGVLSLAGTNGQIFDGNSFTPLAPLDIPAGKRVVAGGSGALPAFTYSSDNTLGFYTDTVAGKRALRVQNFLTGQLTTPVTELDQYRVTPNNQRILYTTKNPSSTTSTLWSVPITGGSATILAVNLLYFGVVSPDSNWFWFTTPAASGTGYDLKLVATAGGVARTVATLPTAEFSSSGLTRNGATLFSPNGQWFIFTSGTTLSSVATNGTAVPTTLAENSSSTVYAPAGSSYVVYRPSDTSASGQLVSIPIAGGAPITLVGAGPSIFFDGFSPDGAYASYDISSSSSSSGQYAVPVAGGTPVNIGPPTTAISVAWTNDGQGNVGVVWRTSSALYYNNVSGTSFLTLTTATSNFSSTPYWVSADGRTVYSYGTSSNILSAYSIPTGAPRQLTDRLYTSTSADTFKLSPDGSRILFTIDEPAGRTLMVMPTAGGTPTPLLNVFDGTVFEWIGNTHVRARRLLTPTPYQFQDGLYVVQVQ